jgi:hypothetical protein
MQQIMTLESSAEELDLRITMYYHVFSFQVSSTSLLHPTMERLAVSCTYLILLLIYPYPSSKETETCSTKISVNTLEEVLLLSDEAVNTVCVLTVT